MKEFNRSLKDGYTYRKKYPGQTPKEIGHNCKFTLEHDRPDICIIHVWTDSLDRDSPAEIATDILEIVDTCHNYGVKDVYVLSITYRPKLENAINTNWLAEAKEFYNGYIFIDNIYINGNHLRKNKVYLNDQGTIILKDNLLSAINGKRTG